MSRHISLKASVDTTDDVPLYRSLRVRSVAEPTLEPRTLQDSRTCERAITIGRMREETQRFYQTEN
eukprot:9057470-Pyramimonas_sp.AAC.1